ncbi:BMC domain-containing protein [Thermanaerovibrio acidaminovorans]|uniref:Microcompartments protein n=1 Tax=Thermanaerovibrio acidaminovorans (strain ATCC 49978 / DSM 6589 / Su883) TaxID=525903 RepID=D1B7R0_THEAS|nr:BMC domain-containing protein [Thermanaerovibrio acidaminovorans]ACZ18313.1 microcompartments protein [Thermanaerovibrio acidaminovorans DSM 6589]
MEGRSTGRALGILEVRGMLGAVEAADSALKGASVALVDLVKVKGGIVTVLLSGDVGSVRAAVDVAVASLGRLGIPVTSHVIARPAPEVHQMLGHQGEPEGKACVPPDEEPKESPAGTGGDVPDLESMTVAQLRRLARSLPVQMDRGRIKFASKGELIRQIRALYRGPGGGERQCR